MFIVHMLVPLSSAETCTLNGPGDLSSDACRGKGTAGARGGTPGGAPVKRAPGKDPPVAPVTSPPTPGATALSKQDKDQACDGPTDWSQ
jgi:hypothetical protein